MSNISRQAAGTKQAGVSVGGQFAAHEQSQAAGAGLSAAPPRNLNPAARAKQADLAAGRRREIARMREEMDRHAFKLFEHEAALTMRGKYPEATDLVLEYDYYQRERQWQFSGLETADGVPVEVSPEDEAAFVMLVDAENLSTEDTYLESETASDQGGERHRIDLVAAERDSHADLSRTFVDTGNMTEHGFSAAFGAARRQLNLSVDSVYSRHDFAELVQSGWRPSDSEDNELSDEQVEQLADVASRIHLESEQTDMEYELGAERRDESIREAGKQLGIPISTF